MSVDSRPCSAGVCLEKETGDGGADADEKFSIGLTPVQLGNPITRAARALKGTQLMARGACNQPRAVWLGLIAWVLLLPFAGVSAADPLGATPHPDGSATFRVLAPFADGVGVRVNGAPALPLAREAGHTDPADTTWAGSIPGVRAGDTYQYEINRGGVVGGVNDPRAQRLTRVEAPRGFGLEGDDKKPRAADVDLTTLMSALAETALVTHLIN